MKDRLKDLIARRVFHSLEGMLFEDWWRLLGRHQFTVDARHWPRALVQAKSVECTDVPWPLCYPLDARQQETEVGETRQDLETGKRRYEARIWGCWLSLKPSRIEKASFIMVRHHDRNEGLAES